MADVANCNVTGYYIFTRCVCGQIEMIPILDDMKFATIHECTCARRWMVRKVPCEDGSRCIEMRLVDQYDNIVAKEPARVIPEIYERLE